MLASSFESKAGAGQPAQIARARIQRGNATPFAGLRSRYAWLRCRKEPAWMSGWWAMTRSFPAVAALIDVEARVCCGQPEAFRRRSRPQLWDRCSVRLGTLKGPGQAGSSHGVRGQHRHSFGAHLHFETWSAAARRPDALPLEVSYRRRDQQSIRWYWAGSSVATVGFAWPSNTSSSPFTSRLLTQCR